MSIADLWRDHQAASFPSGCGGKEIEGIDLVMLDADIAGCVSTFVSAGHLDLDRKRILSQCREEIEVVLQSLQGEAKDYYTRLHKLAVLILEDCAKSKT